MLKSRRLTGHMAIMCPVTGHMAIMCPVTGECGPKFNERPHRNSCFFQSSWSGPGDTAL